MIVRAAMPRIVVIGDAERLSLEVYSEASVMLAASAATVQVEVGGVVVLAATNATVGGSVTAYHDIAGTLTDDLGPSEEWLERWRVTISGETRTFTRRGYLVRVGWQPSIIDSDLLARHPDLLDARKGIVPSGQTLQPYRQTAAETIARRLIKKGRRPWLIFDPSALTEAMVCLSLHYAFTDAKASIGDERYAELAAHYLKCFEDEFETANFTYDDAETGVLDDADNKPAAPTIVLTSGVSWPTRAHGLRRC